MKQSAEVRATLKADTGLADLPQGSRVLLIRLRSMGDTVLMTPAIRLLHDWRPDLRLTVLLEAPWHEILEGNPALESLVILKGKLRTAWQVWRQRYAAVVNLHGGSTSAMLTRVSHAKLTAGYSFFRHGSVYSHHVPIAQEILRQKGPVHTAEHVASCFFWLGVPYAEIPPAEVFASKTIQERVSDKLSAQGLGADEPYAVIHPAAAYESKQWKSKGFAEAGNYLEQSYGLRPVYIGAREDAQVMEDVERHSSAPILKADGWAIRELVALIAGARIFIGNDSGPAHIAAAAGKPVLVIFGSSDSAVWGPWKAVRSAVVQNYFDCNPCPGDRCAVYDEPRCILSITSEQVKVYLDALLRPETSPQK